MLAPGLLRSSESDAVSAYESYLSSVTEALKDHCTRYICRTSAFQSISDLDLNRFDLKTAIAALELLTISAISMLLLAIGSPHVSLRVCAEFLRSGISSIYAGRRSLYGRLGVHCNVYLCLLLVPSHRSLSTGMPFLTILAM